MQPTKSKKIFTIIGVALMAIAGGIFIWYEWGGGRELVNYDTVQTLKTEVKKGEVITKDHLVPEEVDKSSIIAGAITDPEEVIGKESKHYIPAGTQLHINYFEESGLVLKDNQVVAKIPVEWTLAVPDSLRRGDNIVIYAAMYDKQLLNNLSPYIPNETSDSADEKKDGIEETTEDSTEEVITSQPTNSPYPTTESKNELEEVLTTKVAFVKDSSNREVVTVSLNDRLDGSSAISGVEIITTPEEFKLIEDKINKGGKLIIMYSDNDIASVTEKIIEE